MQTQSPAPSHRTTPCALAWVEPDIEMCGILRKGFTHSEIVVVCKCGAQLVVPSCVLCEMLQDIHLQQQL